MVVTAAHLRQTEPQDDPFRAPRESGTQPRRHTMEPQVGQLINNKYRLVRLIGDGGMGSVYEARHELLGTTVALKFLHAMLSRRKGLVERFLQEAQVSARIKSIHVANVSDVDRTPEGLAYMVMEYVEGDTLQTRYEKNYRAGKRMAEDEAFDIMLQMMEGVNAAHALDIVHRDLKPDNVILSTNGRGRTLVKILDFGIAKLKASGEMDRGLTRPGVVMGTPEYMAPEQAFSADRVDARADVFSMGVMFFEMLAGRRPVGGDNAHAIAAQYLEGRVAKLEELAPNLAGPLCVAVHKAMAAEPEQRFDSVQDFRAAIAPYGPRASHYDALADTADSTLDPSLAGIAAGMSTVPKTQPPEDGAVEAADEGFEEEPLETTDAARAAAGELRGATEGAADRSGTMAMPEEAAAHLRAGTEPMADGVAAAQGLNPDATGPNAPAGGTMVADGFVPPPFEPMGQTPAHETPVGPTGPTPGPVMATPEPRGGRKKKKKGGTSMFSILLIAAGVSAAVVGGIYVAQEVNGSGTSAEDDGDPIVDPKKKRRKTSEPDPEPVPQPVSDPDPVPVPSPVDPTPNPTPPPQPNQPRPQPPQPQPPQPQPPQPQPPQPTTPVIPSTLPTFRPPVIPSGFPFPGAIPPRPPIQPKPPPAKPAPQKPKPKRPSYIPPRKRLPRPKATPQPSPNPAPPRRNIPRIRRR